MKNSQVLKVLLFCAAVMCEALPGIANGQVELSGTFVSATATYTCDSGYILEGGSRRRCQNNGKWTGTEPSCRSKPLWCCICNQTFTNFAVHFYSCRL